MAAGLIDIGANLAHDGFDADLDQVLHRAWEAGLAGIVITGSSRESALKALTLARRHPGRLWATAGLHPHHASEWTQELGLLFRELAAETALVSLGECGLDYFRELSPRSDQREAFVAQLQIASELNKPLFLHQRDAHADFLAILREWRPRLGNVVVHCFTDTREALNDYLALDCHIGITGWICDERRGAHLIEAVRDIPDHRLMIETDAPYLLPRTVMHRDLPAPRAHGEGMDARSRVMQEPLPNAQARPLKAASRRNEPAYLPWVVKALAAARDQDEEVVAQFTSSNASRFFGLDA